MRRRAQKKRPLSRLKPVWDSVFENGAKETRTPDPLHAMQVLYQLSYGPMNDGDALGLVPLSYPSLHRGGDQTCRHTATNRPCTATCSAGSSIGS